jgi:hypothetical protein
MSLKHLCVASLLRLAARVSPRDRGGRPVRRPPRLRPLPEVLEPRWALDGSITTYTWDALGDKTSFNDPNNWSHEGPFGGGVGVPGVPAPGSNIAFPPVSLLPPGSPTTINFNSTYPSFPVNIFEIGDSYTFTGNGVSVASGLIVANPYHGNPTNASVQLSNVNLGRQATIYTQQKSTLTIGSATNLTGTRLVLQGGAIKQGGGLLVLDTQNIFAPAFALALQTFEVADGTVTLGTAMDFSTYLFQVDQGAGLDVADGAAVKVGSLSGSGTVDLQGTGAAGDLTSLTAFTPASESDQLTGTVTGAGQFSLQGHGTLALGAIDFGGKGAVAVGTGTLDVNGPIDAGTLQVVAGTFGGLGSWHFSGPLTFQSSSIFNVALDGLAAGTQSTQLVSGDSTTGINLGSSTLAGTVAYEYQAGDQFTIASAPMVQGVFQNVANGLVLLGGNIPFSVTYSGTSVTLTALQSETTTRLASAGGPSHPGQPVTFTATVSTRTAPVAAGTVSFEIGGTVLATEPVTAGGTASFTTTSLPLGSSTVTAVYSGVSNILGSTSAGLTQLVVPYSTVTTVTSSTNPSRIGQPVTLTATVTADGMPVTSGIVTFVRGNTLIGRAALGADGTASMTTSSLPQGDVRIQAAFGGNPDNDGSTSQAFIQAVDRFDTATTLTATTQTRPNGKVREVLVAAVDAIGVAGVTPAGVVIFRRNGRVIGRGRLVGGAATLVLPGRIPARGRFVASFRGNSRYRAGASAPLILPA